MDDPTVSLRDFFERIIKDLKESFDTELRGIKEAVTLALESLNKRLDVMNEFRNTINDMLARLATKDELTIRMDAVDGRLKLLERAQSESKGSSGGMHDLIGWIVGGIMLLLSIATFVLTQTRSNPPSAPVVIQTPVPQK